MKTNAVPLNETTLGSGLVLSAGDTILQTSLPVDAHRMARSLYGLTAGGIASLEGYIYSPNGVKPSLAAVAGVPPACIGAVLPTAPFNKFVGQDTNGVCYTPDGNIVAANSVVATYAPYTYGDRVGLVIDYVNKFLTFRKNGSVVGTYDFSAFVSASPLIYYAATVSGNPGDIGWWINAGQSQFGFADEVGGFFHVSQGVTPAYVATEGYISASADARPNQKYQQQLDQQNTKISAPMGVKFWFMGNSAPKELVTNAQVQLQINDPHHKYDSLMSENIRDQLVSIAMVQAGQAQSTQTPVVTLVIDHCEQPHDQWKVLYCNSKLSLLDSQMIRALFPPDADPAFAGKPYPYSGGICRTYAGSQWNSTVTPLPVQLSDTVITAFGKVLQSGVEQGYSINFTIGADGKSVTLPNSPNGKWTFETTTFGGKFDPAATDILNGDGVFASAATDGGGTTGSSTSNVTVGTGHKVFSVAGGHFVSGSKVTATASGGSVTGTVSSYSGGSLDILVTSVTGSGSYSLWTITGGVGQPHGWSGSGRYFTAYTPDQVWQIKGSVGSQWLEQFSDASRFFWLDRLGYTVAAGASYAFEVVLKQAPYYGPAVDALGNPIETIPAYLMFGGSNDVNLQFIPWTKFAIADPQNYSGGPTPSPVSYRGTFTNNSGASQDLVLGFLCNEMIQGTGGITSLLQIKSIKIVQLPSLTQQTVLDGPGLDLMLQDIMIGHGPLQDSDYDSSGAQAIDSATGYKYGLHVGSNENPKVMECVQRLLDSCCAAMYVDEDGKFQVVRCIAPEDVDDADIDGELTENDVLGFLTPYEDLAEGLRTRLSGAPQPDKYTESDFSNVSQSDVPQIERKSLEQDFMWTVTANATLAERYYYAMLADPLPSQLDRQADGQAEINRVCGFFTDNRNYYRGDYPIRSDRNYRIGRVWKQTYAPLPTLATGQKLLIIGKIPKPEEGRVTIIWWGL